MYRFASEYLKAWKIRSGRKPLILRGARQIGKTYLIREFAEECFEQFVEINFERNPEIGRLFSSNDPKRIVQLLEIQFNTSIDQENTLLFLDEIQAAPEIILSLRYFYEELPALHIIAAGSLIEFALDVPTFSIPVGRIEYMYLGPVQFEEFIIASGNKRLAEFLANYRFKEDIPEPIHNQLMALFRIYLIVGGMPESVSVYLETNSMQQTEMIKHSLLSTFQDDFSKYGKKFNYKHLQLLLRKIPFLVGSKFKYVLVNRETRSKDLSESLTMLCQARIAFKVHHSSCNGIPLGATLSDKTFKVVFLDVGLLSTSTGLSLLDFENAEDVMLVNSGAVCEQFIGQHLLFSREYYQEPELFYWVREKKQSSAEIDYVISEGSQIVPVEVKAGKSGTLKSLHLFIREKGRPMGLRFNSERPSILDTKTSIANGNNVAFQLISLPLYLVSQTRRIIRNITGR